jgi:hypothetical protein
MCVASRFVSGLGTRDFGHVLDWQVVYLCCDMLRLSTSPL